LKYSTSALHFLILVLHILSVLLSLSLILFKLFAYRQSHPSILKQLLQICRLLLTAEHFVSR
ncbi:hypothetical protein PMAYCL1PPCAC_08393, partial [Pristionchus mayeri]